MRQELEFTIHTKTGVVVKIFGARLESESDTPVPIISAFKWVENFRSAITSDKMQDEESDIRLSKTSAVMRALHHSVVLKTSAIEKDKTLARY